MTNDKLQAIEERWAKWINPKSAPKTLGGDFLILLAEVRLLNELLEMRCAGCHLRKESEVADKWLRLGQPWQQHYSDLLSSDF